jgi:phage shock protein PspC (stress-responsive transcriptional regulator)
MIKLVIAVGFLAVFGIVAYAVVVLLVNLYKKPTEKDNKEDKQDLNK